MKLFIQIPCFNEEKDIERTINSLPVSLNGIDKIEILVINDGSTDSTINILNKIKLVHVLNIPRRLGLANAFSKGLEYCLLHKADIILNTDADNQYQAKYIQDLIDPILKNDADLVIGSRNFYKIKKFSRLKIFFQKLGSWVISYISNLNIIDSTSGFRAMSRNFAKNVNIYNEFTYTHEMIIQAGFNNYKIANIPVETNEVLRESRLFKSNFEYILKSSLVIIKIFIIYKPAIFFTFISLPFFLIAFFFIIKFIFLTQQVNAESAISLFLIAVFLINGIVILLVGFLSSLISVNRILLEKILKKID